MLQYDLTETRFFDADPRVRLPNDAEMFAITAALLLYHHTAYTNLAECEIVFHEADLAGIAECLEYRLPVFLRDIGEGRELRQRLRDFVGLHIGSGTSAARQESSHPT